MAQVAFPDQDNKWLLSHLMRGLQCYPSAQELSTVLFLDFLPSLLPSIIGLKGSIFQGSIPRAGGHRTCGEIQQNGRDVHATLQVQPVSVLISHLFLSNWQSSISILNFTEEIFFPHSHILQLHQNSHSACGAAANQELDVQVSPLLEFQYYYLDNYKIYKDPKY